MRRQSILVPGFAALVTTLCVAGSARATLIAEETFSYSAGQTVNGLSGGTGWSGGWITGQPGAFTTVGAIGGGPAINATGGAMKFASMDGRVFRKLDLSAGSPAAMAGLVKSHSAMFFNTIDGIGAPGTTVWVAMLLAGGDSQSGHETQYHLYDGAKTDAVSLALADQNKDGEVVAMLRGGNVGQWGFERTCNHSNCNGGAGDGYFSNVNFGGIHWSVVRYVFSAQTTEITMWIDPTPGMTPPDDAAAISLTPFGGGNATKKTVVPALFFDHVTVNGSAAGNFTVDEIRIGTSFADVSGTGGGGMGGGGMGGAGGMTGMGGAAGSGGNPGGSGPGGSGGSGVGGGQAGSGGTATGGSGGGGVGGGQAGSAGAAMGGSGGQGTTTGTGGASTGGAGTGATGGTGGTNGGDGGCGCSLPGEHGSPEGALVALGIGLALARTRRRTTAGRGRNAPTRRARRRES